LFSFKKNQKKTQNPIEGLVYRCSGCEDFDLCENCFKSSLSFHPEHEFKEFEKRIYKRRVKAHKEVQTPSYETEMTLLTEMGFGNPDLNKSLLQKSFGNIQDVVKELIKL